MITLAHPTARVVREGKRFVVADGSLEYGFAELARCPCSGTRCFVAHAYQPKENGVHPALYGDFPKLKEALAFILAEGVAV